MLDWQTLIPGNDDKRWIKGTEIERAFPDGFRHRFSIVSVRTIDREMFEGKLTMQYDVFYRVRDVEAANDAHFKAGKPAPIFGEFATLDEALNAIEPHRIKEDA